jgi:hypothetical protein
MSIKCPCGEEIAIDGTHIHLAGRVVPEQTSAACFETPAEEIAEFIDAVVQGRRQDWIEAYYGHPGFNLHDANVVFDILTRRHAQTLLQIRQCEHCGRILLERAPNSDVWRVFAPESRDFRCALAGLALTRQELLESVVFAEDRPPWWKVW